MIYIAKQDSTNIGGGWSWISNALKVLPTTNYKNALVYLIPSPSMVSKEEVDQAQADGKKIVLRVDNIVRNSRNRNTGMSRMKRFADQADLVIYQSNFAMGLLRPFIQKDGVVILNGCDQSIFNPKGRQESTTGRYMYSRVNRDETKNWEMARLYFQHVSQNQEDTKLHIVGHFSPELQEYNFDFYMDENYQFWGIMKDPQSLAQIYKDTDYFIYTYFNDACSNSLIEAISSGCYIADPYRMLATGGATEIVNAHKLFGEEFLGLDRMGTQYKEAISQILPVEVLSEFLS